MATKSNFILKVQDAKLADVQKALKDAIADWKKNGSY